METEVKDNKLTDTEAVKIYMDLEKSRKTELKMEDALTELRALDALQQPKYGFSTPIITDIARRTTELRRLITNNILRFEVATATLISIFNSEPLTQTEPNFYEK